MKRILSLIVLFAAVVANAQTETIVLPESISTVQVRVPGMGLVHRWMVNLSDFRLLNNTQDRVREQVRDPRNWYVTYTVPSDKIKHNASVVNVDNSVASKVFYVKVGYPSNATITEVGFSAATSAGGKKTYKLEATDKPVFDPSEDPADPFTFNVKGVASQAKLLDGTKADTYRADMGIDFGTIFDRGYGLNLDSTLSSKSDDREAKFSLRFSRTDIPVRQWYTVLDYDLSFIGNQAFTNNGVTFKFKGTTYIKPLIPASRSYTDTAADWMQLSEGIAFTRMLRVDSRLGNGTDPKNALYGYFSLVAPGAYFANGFGEINLSAYGYLFSSDARKNFPGLKTLESYVDLELLVPFLKPRLDRDAKWQGGTWFKIGWKNGIVPENAFTRSSGLTYGLAAEFKF